MRWHWEAKNTKIRSDADKEKSMPHLGNAVIGGTKDLCDSCVAELGESPDYLISYLASVQ
jgi:hypothetical protein